MHKLTRLLLCGFSFIATLIACNQSATAQTADPASPTDIPPLLSGCTNRTAECTGGLTPVTYTITALDSSGNSLPVSCTPPSGTGFRLGVSNVVCRATDSVGVSSSCNFTVTVV